jgi:thymidylate synthase (FAD)
MDYPINDPHFRVEVLAKTERPNLICYLAMHQDYSEGATFDDYEKLSQLSEEELGDRLVRKCIKYSHWGILEHPSISFNIIGFPHSVIVQARTHRIGVTFDCQSQRYTSKRIEKLAVQLIEGQKQNYERIEKVFYFRPIGNYIDRQGDRYLYGDLSRESDLEFTWKAIKKYQGKLNNGYAPEHARDFLTQNIRQHFVVTFNARSLLHFCDLRLPSDAQLEIRTMAEMIFEKFKIYMPEVAEFYEKTRKGKNKLSP